MIVGGHCREEIGRGEEWKTGTVQGKEGRRHVVSLIIHNTDMK